MGTELYRHNVFTNRCFDELCLSQPELVKQVHRGYLEAGVDVITSNSFGANRVALAAYGLAEKTTAINAAAVAIAREVAEEADRPVFVGGSVGPLPAEAGHQVDAPAILREQVEALAAAGADVILFETQPSRTALENCARAMQDGPEIPFVLSCTVFEDAESAMGESLERLLAPLPEGLPRPVAWGLNCGVGPDGILQAVEQAVQVADHPLIVQPNAGVPREVNHRRIYMCSPEYLSTYARRYLDLGAAGVGGCCGTTPEQIAEVVQAIKPLLRKPVDLSAVAASEETEPLEPEPFENRSRLSRALSAQRWVTTVELVPPKGFDLTSTIEKASVLYRRGVDALNLPDGPRASSRLSPLITATEIQRQAQIEVILHFCCRDRNLIGMQADLLGCAAAEIRNILFVTGDPPKLGKYPSATGVFDADSIDMCRVQDRLNRGLDLGGQRLAPATQAVLGVGADPSAVDFELEVRRFREKVEAGAEFAITQPVFDPDALLRVLDKVDYHGVPTIAGIWPLASYRNALFMQNEVPGVEIPPEIMERMGAFESREDQRRVGIEVAIESVHRVRDRVAGIQVSAPFGNIDTAWAVIEGSGSKAEAV
jgi:homocysteine S-methyltransferase